jgi:hypothetical protein
MHDLGSKNKSGGQDRHRPVACPTLSHLSAAGRPAQMRADWAFVSPVSAVSPNLKTNRDYRIAEWRLQ